MDAKETSFYTAVLIICLVLGIIITYFIVSIIRQHRTSIQLYRQSLLTEITTLEKERSRMSADLHDEVGPVLSAVKLRLSSLDVSAEDDRQVLQETNVLIDDLVQRMRDISFNLMPNSLLNKGIQVAITEFISYCSKSSPLQIRFQYTDIQLSQQQAINLYRIIQEIIHNTIKHSKATELLIELRHDKHQIVLASRDNGIGFFYDSRLKQEDGQGLRNMISRAEIIGGKLYCESEKGKGTTYIFEIPMGQNESDKTY
ncbi:MAG: sensor histidine kinase [Flavisolibacter sp.]